MNTRRSEHVDAVPPAAVDSVLPGTSRLIVPQVHMVTGRIKSATAGVPDTSIEAQDFARLAKEIGHISAQNDHLLKSVDMLLSMHESEKTQRQALQGALDRLTEEVGISTPTQLLETVGTELRSGVSEDLKPLLQAIIELLELLARRGSAHPATTPESKEISGATDPHENVAKRDKAADQLPPEDLPGALPVILTKSVEELVGKRRADRPKPLKSKKPGADGNQGHTAFKGHRTHAWIPVTSSTFKS